MLAETVDAVIGIDTHRDTREVEIADPPGKPIAVLRISNDSAGFARLPVPRADGDWANKQISVTAFSRTDWTALDYDTSAGH